jgi:hypothetical protein
MEPGLRVNKYQVTATFRAGIAEWRFAVETEDGQRHEWPVRDGEEIPVLLEIMRRDATVYYDPRTCTLTTGWNDPGS